MASCILGGLKNEELTDAKVTSCNVACVGAKGGFDMATNPVVGVQPITFAQQIDPSLGVIK